MNIRPIPALIVSIVLFLVLFVVVEILPFDADDIGKIASLGVLFLVAWELGGMVRRMIDERKPKDEDKQP